MHPLQAGLHTSISEEDVFVILPAGFMWARQRFKGQVIIEEIE